MFTKARQPPHGRHVVLCREGGRTPAREGEQDCSMPASCGARVSSWPSTCARGASAAAAGCPFASPPALPDPFVAAPLGVPAEAIMASCQHAAAADMMPAVHAVVACKKELVWLTRGHACTCEPCPHASRVIKSATPLRGVSAPAMRSLKGLEPEWPNTMRSPQMAISRCTAFCTCCGAKPLFT